MKKYFVNKKIIPRVIIIIAIILFIFIEIKMSDIPFVKGTPLLIELLFQKPLDSTFSYLLFNTSKSILIGVFGACLYDIILVQLPKWLININKHKEKLNEILFSIENIISIYLLTNGYDSSLSNLSDEKFSNTGICLTNETIYYKDVHDEYYDKIYIFDSYKKNVSNILSAAKKILNARFPIPPKYEDYLDQLVSANFITFIQKRKFAETTEPNQPFKLSLSNAFSFKPDYIKNLHNFYIKIKRITKYNKEFLFKRINKKEYLEDFIGGLIFCGADRFLNRDYLFSDVDDIKELLKMSVGDSKFYKNVDSVVKLSDEIEIAYHESMKLGYDDPDYILKKWVELLNYCTNLFDDKKTSSAVDVLIEYYKFKTYMKDINDEDIDFLKTYVKKNKDYPTEKLFFCYVLSKDLDNAKLVYGALDKVKRAEVMKSPIWDIYKDLDSKS